MKICILVSCTINKSRNMTSISRGTYGVTFKNADGTASKYTDLDDFYGVREVAIRALIPDHPNIIKFHSVNLDVDARHMIINMPYYRHTLESYLVGRRLTVDNMLKIAIAIVSGVKHMHSEYIVHLDIKPSNILLNNVNECVLIDFGLSMRTGSIACHDIAPQTPGYGAPESLAKMTIVPSLDIWSVGCVLYKLLFGIDFIKNPGNVMSKMANNHKFIYFRQYSWASTSAHHASGMKKILVESGEYFNVATYERKRQFAQIIAQCLDVNPAKRITADKLLAALHHLNDTEETPIMQEVIDVSPIMNAFYSHHFINQCTRDEIVYLMTKYNYLNFNLVKNQLALVYIASAAYNVNDAYEFSKYLSEKKIHGFAGLVDTPLYTKMMETVVELFNDMTVTYEQA